ncbi:NAD(P)H-binding protein [Saccharomonospora sp. NPDC046836]|uniref:NAD(P)H-binding protein n=1 Tax=Saccharomonospora sp. NPDC046836 TaxID=3156921 RepID=UPI00340EB53E
MNAESITALGGTGKTGRRVARLLLADGYVVKAASRRGSTRFDWADEGSWADAVTGASAVYIVPDESPSGTDRLATFTRRAVDSGVRRLVLLSAREWVDTGYADGLAREEVVRSSGTAWTILRPVWFAQNFSEEPFLADGVTEGELVFGTGDGRHPFIDAEDIAAVAAAALTQDRHHGHEYELTGPKAITITEAVEIIAAELGRSILTHAATAAEYWAFLTGRYYSEEGADGSVAMSEFIRNGNDARLSDGVQRALGREPRDFTAYTRRCTRGSRGTPDR